MKYVNASIPKEFSKIKFSFLQNSLLILCNHVKIISNTKRSNAKRVFFTEICIFFKIAPINFHQRLRTCNHVKIVSNTKRSNAKRVFPHEICHFLQDRPHRFSLRSKKWTLQSHPPSLKIYHFIKIAPKQN